MVGKAVSITNSHQLHQHRSTSINNRELFILTLGLLEAPKTMDQLFILTNNLYYRMKHNIKFSLPSRLIFEQIILKLIKQGVFKRQYSIIDRKYIVKLSEMGYGELDGLIRSIINERLIKIFEEFKQLVSYTI